MVSLDGYYKGLNGEIDWHNVDAEFNDYAIDFLDSVDLLVFGRVTYELMASYWPTPAANQDDPLVAKRMNSLSKVVFSGSLRKVEWENTKLVTGNAVEEMLYLKKQSKADMAIFGSSNLARTFTHHKLIDEYRIFVNPVILGRGTSLLEGLEGKSNLRHVGTRTFRSGNVLLVYQPSNLER